MNKISPSRSDFVAERWGQRSLRRKEHIYDINSRTAGHFGWLQRCLPVEAILSIEEHHKRFPDITSESNPLLFIAREQINVNYDQ